MRFKRFLSKLPDTKFLEKYTERKNGLLGIEVESIVHLSFRDVKETIPELFTSGRHEEALFLILKATKKKVKFMRVKRADNFDKLQFVFWIQDQYKAISNLEAEYLSTPPEQEMIAAGINELDVLGMTNLVDALAGGDVLKWETVKDLSYETLFDKQHKTTIENRISRRLKKNQKNKMSR
tara:strand:+ start:3972 stop:4511 length:540 start_codon:yes stop_codon:yes gene_type:complete